MLRKLSAAVCLLAAGPPLGAADGPATPAAGAQKAPDSFVQEIRLGVDRAKLEGRKSVRDDEKRLEEALKKRFAIVGAKEGRVEVRSLDDVRMKIPAERVDATQLKMLCVPGQLEFRNLDEVQTNLNPGGRYLIDVLTIQDEVQVRFKDRNSGRIVRPAEFLPKCPRVLGPEDVAAGSARMIRDGALMFVRLDFDKGSTDRLERFLSRPGRLLAVVLDGEILSINAVARKIQRLKKGEKRDKDELEDVSQLDIAGGFKTEDEAIYLAAVFNAGPLPLPLKVLSTQIIAE